MKPFGHAVRQISNPCGKNCQARSAGCSARCCNWALYESYRNHAYAKNYEESNKRALNDGAIRNVTGVGKRRERKRAYEYDR